MREESKMKKVKVKNTIQKSKFYFGFFAFCFLLLTAMPKK